ncbi:helix-turn-helix transcriptional regulator [Corynebacterium sp. HMSC076D02]|uniref:helix-turn-helix domain-containing protein n=1 Tax=Corynebacterium sp. HMSC076D02 TaxID=1739439 RepID=UPI0008A5D3CC|nr:helix-turn-helix transcriptional regulator [Corynebacterium sp. HMSC076D02]OFQ48490.1 hypothetical protein HMPREF2935_00665 [Corynebacterium sp. HMSC076D02]
MFTIIAKDNRVTATDFEGLRAALLDELFNTGREGCGPWEDWIEAVYPADTSEVDEDYTPPVPRELTQENLEAFAAWVFDTPSARLIHGEPPIPATLQAIHEFIGWSLDDAAEALNVSKRTYQRWLSGQMVAPPRVEGEMRRAAHQVIDRAKHLAASDSIAFNLDDDPAERRAHALAEVLYRD